MDNFEIIQHPLDRFSLTGSMARLDARGRESADQLMTMIGDIRFCRGDIRGTCARYFVFIDTEWFCKLCLEAHIDSRKLRDYLWRVENKVANELLDTFDDPQTSFCFPKNENQPIGALCSTPGTQSETIYANSMKGESHTAGSGPSIQKLTPKRIHALEHERLA